MFRAIAGSDRPFATLLRRAWRNATAAVLGLAGMLGCVSTPAHTRLAEAGVAYASAVATLAETAATLSVDATSARLLQDDALANLDLTTYTRFNEEDDRRLVALARLGDHARVLRRYFALLQDLGEGRAGRRTLTAIDGAAAALDRAGEALRGSGWVTSAAPVTVPARTAATFYGRRLLQREVSARAPLLRAELVTQQEILKALGGALRHDLELLAAAREQREVIAPLLAAEPVADAERWMAERRAALTVKPTLAALAAAAGAAAELEDAVAGVAAERPDHARIEELLADAEAIAAALAAAGVDRESP